ncbi:MAG TPA: lytic transglycosylase domain-containing protein [Candidatus Binatia bacterium]|jgi:soluble lytic murein transglycosylase
MRTKHIWLRSFKPPFHLALSCFILLPWLFPSQPLAESKARRLHETAEIYLTLRLSNRDLNHSSASAVAETIWRESEKHALDPMLVLAIIKVESEFRPAAISSYGARGLMQLLPVVAHSLVEDADVDLWEGERSLHDPVTNIKLGAFYLGRLKKKFGDLKVALTAYSHGPTWVQKQIESKITLPEEYAKKVLSVSRNYREQGRDRRGNIVI